MGLSPSGGWCSSLLTVARMYWFFFSPIFSCTTELEIVKHPFLVKKGKTVMNFFTLTIGHFRLKDCKKDFKPSKPQYLCASHTDSSGQKLVVNLEELSRMIGGRGDEFLELFCVLKRKSISANNAILQCALRRLAEWSCPSFQQAVQLLL